MYNISHHFIPKTAGLKFADKIDHHHKLRPRCTSPPPPLSPVPARAGAVVMSVPTRIPPRPTPVPCCVAAPQWWREPAFLAQANGRSPFIAEDNRINRVGTPLADGRVLLETAPLATDLSRAHPSISRTTFEAQSFGTPPDMLRGVLRAIVRARPYLADPPRVRPDVAHLPCDRFVVDPYFNGRTQHLDALHEVLPHHRKYYGTHLDAQTHKYHAHYFEYCSSEQQRRTLANMALGGLAHLSKVDLVFLNPPFNNLVQHLQHITAFLDDVRAANPRAAVVLVITVFALKEDTGLVRFIEANGYAVHQLATSTFVHPRTGQTQEINVPTVLVTNMHLAHEHCAAANLVPLQHAFVRILATVPNADGFHHLHKWRDRYQRLHAVQCEGQRAQEQLQHQERLRQVQRRARRQRVRHARGRGAAQVDGVAQAGLGVGTRH